MDTSISQVYSVLLGGALAAFGLHPSCESLPSGMQNAFSECVGYYLVAPVSPAGHRPASVVLPKASMLSPPTLQPGPEQPLCAGQSENGISPSLLLISEPWSPT